MDHFICIAFLLVYFSFIVNMAGGQAQQVGDCGGFEKKPSGSIQTPNYPLNYPEDKVCFWIIEVQAGDKVVLSFESFALEDHASCQYDYVLIRDGMSPRSPWIGTFCGTSRPATITSTDNYLWISFKSDSTATNQGFKAIWASEGSSVDFATTTSSTAATSRGTTVHGAVSPSPSTPRPTSSQTPHSGCGGQLTGEGGLFTSPNYPVSYPVNIQCVWRIVTKPTGSVELTFQDFHLENSGSCEFDFVEIRDGAMVDSPLIGTFCSSMIIGKIISTGNSLLVRLTSDSSVSEKGFNASWKLVSYTTSTTSMPPSSTPLSTTIRPVCGGTFTKMTGSMRSPHYPEDYPESVTCQWIIKLPVQYKVKLEFSDFLLENSESCRFDFVLVMDGLPSSPTPIGKFCGNGSKDAVESKSNFLTVLFKSDSSMTKKGFEAYWSAIPVFTEKPTSVSTSSKVPPGEIITTPPQCGGNPKKPSGDLFSPYYPNPSFEPVDCQWVLSVYEGNNISVGFNEFDLNSDENCNTEYVELRDGGLDSSKLLGRYCKSAPMIIYGSQNKMWMRYHSDGTGSRGFEVTWITMAQAIKPMESSEESNPSLIGPIPHPSKKCGDALGVESGEIKDAQLSASSSWRGIRTFGAQHARLNNQQWPQGWSADVRDKNPWLKVSLDVDHVITGIATQGHGSLVFSERVESYFVVWLDIRAGNVYYHEDGKVKIFVGNSDHDTVVRHVLKEPFITKQLTIRPITWKENVGLRMELYGCTLDTCQEPLGLENGNVKDGQLTASSAWSNDPNKFGAHRARLNLNRWPSGWTANAKDLSPWLQVNLNDPFIVTRVATQGYGGASDQWVETYRMSWKNGEGIWRNYSIPHRRLSTSKVQWKTKIFHGNKDRTSIVSHTLGNAIHSSTIRIWPLKKHNFISMRAELYGCLAEPSPSGTNCTRKGHRMSGESNPPYKMDCQWNVTSSTDKGAVILKFTSFDFSRSDPSCIKDYVEVRNGPTEDAPLIGKFCGGKAPSPVQSSGSSLWVRYVVSGKIQTKVEMTYHDDPDKENKLENEKGYQGCGTRVHTTPRSHLGGDTSKQWSGQWPWLVSLSLIGQSMQQCSGALIAPTWVLTAAHCFGRYVGPGAISVYKSYKSCAWFKQPSQWVVRAGEFDLAVNEGYEQNIRAQSIHIHSQYKVETNENDIALVNLEKSVEINDKVSVLCLPHQGSVQPGASCVVAGWGFASNFHRSSTPLRSHTVPVVSRRTCNKVNSYAGLVKEKMICAGFEEGGDDRCYGDGGGPLMCKDSQGKWFVGGINSWGEGCGLRGKYGVFTLTESFRDWIDRYLRDNS